LRVWIFGLSLFILGWILSWLYHRPVENFTESGQESAGQKSYPIISPIPKLTGRTSNSVLPTQVETHASTTLERAATHLKTRQYSEFFALFQEVQARADDATLQVLRKAAYASAKQLQQAKRSHDAQSLLQQLIANDYDNVPAHLLLAAVHRHKGNYLVALEQLYSARSYAQETELVAQITRQIHQWGTDFAARYKKEKHDLALIDLYRNLSEKEPEYAPHYLGLAEAYLALGNKTDAKLALELASFDVEVSDQVQRLLAQIHQKNSVTLTNATAIPLRRYGDHYVIKVMLNGELEASLMLDTGATLSIITPQVQVALGVSPSDRVAWFNTANGMVESVLLSIDSISAGSKGVQDTKVGVLNLSTNPHFDGLLGMDFLKHFKFYIDQDKHVLYLQ
jgi:clan AA aspartic protease (TIGR02281 family)